MQQLPLQIQPRVGCTFDSFFPGPNRIVTDVLQAMANKQGERQVFVWGGRGIGKSHLLQAVCQAAAAQNLTAGYLPLAEMQSMSADILDGMEQLTIIAIDDLQQVITDKDWQRALFTLINHARASESRLIFAADASPAELEITLADLRSRLSWGPVFHLQPLSDTEKLEALQNRAHLRGLELPEQVANYLLQHYPRDLFTLFDTIETLDQASLAQQRRLTIPFVKSVLT